MLGDGIYKVLIFYNVNIHIAIKIIYLVTCIYLRNNTSMININEFRQVKRIYNIYEMEIGFGKFNKIQADR